MQFHSSLTISAYPGIAWAIDNYSDYVFRS